MSYNITYDINRFPLLEETGLELSMQATSNDMLDLHGEPKGDNWTPIHVKWEYFEQPKENGLPDIALWRAGQYACSEKALPFFQELLGDSCEFLELKAEERNWYAIHVLKTVDAIDRDKTVLNLKPDGRVSRVQKFKRLVFKKDVINSAGLCHVKDAGLHLYCSQRFYEAVMNNRLTGLEFHRVEAV